jgi:hypothetical protein
LLGSGSLYDWDVTDGDRQVAVQTTGTAVITDSTFARELAIEASRLDQLEFLRPNWPVKCHCPHDIRGYVATDARRQYLRSGSKFFCEPQLDERLTCYT